MRQDKTRKYPEHFTSSQKRNITLKVRKYTPQQIQHDYNALVKIGKGAKKVSERVLSGNMVVDAFTFQERLDTISSKGLSFFEFWAHQRAFMQKPHIRKFIEYSKKNRTYETHPVRMYNTYRLHYGSVNLFKPLLAMEYYAKYKPHTVLDFTMGWGGRLVGACALNVPRYIGIDANKKLRAPYSKLQSFLAPQTETEITLLFQDALDVDYSQWKYDMVFTSPPYYNLEKYKGVDVYPGKDEWDAKFYTPLFSATFQHLQPGGVYVLNIPVELYERVCKLMWGKATHVFPMKKIHRHTKNMKRDTHTEMMYVWKKK